MRNRLLRVIAVLGIAVGLAACGQSSSPPGAVVVNGQAMPAQLYDTLVAATKHRLELQNPATDWNSASGRQRLTSIQSQALNLLVRDAVIEQLAREQHLEAGPGDVDETMSQLETAAGGQDALNRKIEEDGLSRTSYRTLLRYTILDRKLRAAQPDYDAALQRAIGKAKVEAYAGPCANQHDYPRCAG